MTVPRIAAQTGVATETVYRVFGTKAALFRAVVEALLAGGIARAATPVAERPAIRAIIEEPDPRRQVALYAATQPGIHRRAGPTLRALRDAQSGEPELALVWTDLEKRRYDGQRKFVERLAAEGALRPELSVDAATDAVWALCSLAVYDLLAIGRAWTDDAYEDWLASVLMDQLLGVEVDPNSYPAGNAAGGRCP